MVSELFNWIGDNECVDKAVLDLFSELCLGNAWHYETGVSGFF